jgi:hypothetical protein
MAGPASDLEAEAAEAGKELRFDDFPEVIEAGRAALELTAGTVVIAGAEHRYALAHPADSRLDGSARHEDGAQLLNRAAHVPVGIRPQAVRKIGDAGQRVVDVVELSVHDE